MKRSALAELARATRSSRERCLSSDLVSTTFSGGFLLSSVVLSLFAISRVNSFSLRQPSCDTAPGSLPPCPGSIATTNSLAEGLTIFFVVKPSLTVGEGRDALLTEGDNSWPVAFGDGPDNGLANVESGASLPMRSEGPDFTVETLLELFEVDSLLDSNLKLLGSGSRESLNG